MLSLAQILPVSESFSEGDIAEWINPDEQQKVTGDMIVDVIENREHERSNTT